MRLVRTEALEAGMLLALPILSSTGALLLREDLVLTERTIALLKKQAVPFVYIRDRRFPDAAEEPLLHPETFQRALKELQDLFATATAARGNHLPPERMERIQSVLRDILEDVFDRSDRLVLRFLALRGHDGYIFTHSALVATTSLLLGQELSFSYAQLYNLGLGALLHDLGMTTIPSEIVDKKGPLDREERSLVNLHPRGGWDLLAGHDLVWPTARIVALQHHERWDGSGYPGGLRGEEIHLLSRIVAVADVYDALVSPRPYRPCRTPWEAHALILEGSGSLFDPRVVEAFFRVVAPYPVGTWLRLSTGHVGLVTAIPAEAPHRPRLSLTFHPEVGKLTPPMVMPLAACEEIRITEALEEEPNAV